MGISVLKRKLPEACVDLNFAHTKYILSLWRYRESRLRTPHHAARTAQSMGLRNSWVIYVIQDPLTGG